MAKPEPALGRRQLLTYADFGSAALAATRTGKRADAADAEPEAEQGRLILRRALVCAHASRCTILTGRYTEPFLMW